MPLNAPPTAPLAGRCCFWLALAVLLLQVFRFEMPSFMDDAVNGEGVAHDFIHDAIGIHADLAHVLFADFRGDSSDMTSARQMVQLCKGFLSLYQKAMDGAGFGWMHLEGIETKNPAFAGF